MIHASRRALKSLVVAEHNGSQLTAGTFAAITAAGKFNEPVTVLVAGHNAGSIATAAAAAKGVSEVIHVDAPFYDKLLPEPVGALIPEIRKSGDFKRVIAPHSGFGKQTLPRAAALESVVPVPDVLAIPSPATFTRPFYAGNAIVDGSFPTSGPAYVTVRPTSFEKAAPSGGSAAVKTAPAGADPASSKFIADKGASTDKIDLASARTVVSGGRGLKTGDNFKLLDELAAKLPNAAVGATRAVVDAGMCPPEMQVGQTGKIVAPDLYIAVGLSGAIQHLAGMKDSKVIVAINNDADAPIHAVSDYSLVKDLFEVVPELTKAL